MTITISDGGRSYQMNDPGGRIGKSMRTGKPYEWKMLNEIRKLGLTGSALDIGAHVGNHALYLAKVCDLTVFAFEPNEDAYGALVENIELNEDVPGPVFAYPLAVGVADQPVEWDPDRKMALLPLSTGDPAPSFTTTALDDMVQLEDLVLVKVDVEGWEPNVFAGMVETLRASRPVIYSEVHDQNAVDDQRAVLRPIGYQLDHYMHMGSRMACWKVDR